MRASAFFMMKNKQPLLTFALLSALIPSILGYDFIINSGYHDTQRIFEIVFILLAGIFSIRKKQHPSPFTFCFFLFFITCGLFSTLNSKNTIHAIFSISLYYLLIIAIISLSSEYFKDQNKFESTLFKGLTLGYFLYSVSSLSYLINSYLSSELVTISNLIPGYDNYRFLNHCQTITIPLLTFLLIKERSINRTGILNNIAFFSLTTSWSLLFLTGGRGTLAAFTASALLVFFLKRKAAISFLISFTLIGFIGYLQSKILYTIIPNIINKPLDTISSIERSKTNFLSGREELWLCAIEKFKENPTLGISPMGFSNYCKEINFGAHPHNIYIQTIVEWGFPGIIVLILIAIFLISIYKNIPKRLSVFIIFTTFSIAVDGLVSGNFVMPTSQIWIVIFFGMLYGSTQADSEEKNPSIRRIKHMTQAITFIMILILIYTSFATYQYSLKSQSDHTTTRSLLKPRAWSAGYLD